MDNNQFNQFNQFNPMNGNNSTKTLFSYIGLGCSALGALLTFIFSIVTCARGEAATEARGTLKKPMVMSYFWIGILVGIIICIAGVVLLILSVEKGTQMSKITMVGLIVACAGIVYGFLTITTICSYTCSFNSNYYDKFYKQYSSWLD